MASGVEASRAVRPPCPPAQGLWRPPFGRLDPLSHPPTYPMARHPKTKPSRKANLTAETGETADVARDITDMIYRPTRADATYYLVK